MLLAFVFLFKNGERFLDRLSIVFDENICSIDHKISHYAKIFGWWAMTGLTFPGGILAGHIKSRKVLISCGIVMIATNLLFVALIIPRLKMWVLTFAVVVDNIISAICNSGIYRFCVNGVFISARYRDTIYTSYTSGSGGGLLRMCPASSGGWMRARRFGGNWVGFFVITAVMVLSLLLLWFCTMRCLQVLTAHSNFLI